MLVSVLNKYNLFDFLRRLKVANRTKQVNSMSTIGESPCVIKALLQDWGSNCRI